MFSIEKSKSLVVVLQFIAAQSAVTAYCMYIGLQRNSLCCDRVYVLYEMASLLNEIIIEQCIPFMLEVYDILNSLTLTLSSLSSEKVSTMIPNTMFRPMVVTMMKKETSSSSLAPATLNSGTED